MIVLYYILPWKQLQSWTVWGAQVANAAIGSIFPRSFPKIIIQEIGIHQKFMNNFENIFLKIFPFNILTSYAIHVVQFSVFYSLKIWNITFVSIFYFLQNLKHDDRVFAAAGGGFRSELETWPCQSWLAGESRHVLPLLKMEGDWHYIMLLGLIRQALSWITHIMPIVPRLSSPRRAYATKILTIPLQG